MDEVLERAGAVASIKSPEAEGVRRLLERLGTMWGELQEQAERRQQTLDATYQLEQYYFDVAEVESWLGGQELLLMSEEKGKVLMGVACGRKKFKTPPSISPPQHVPPPSKDEQSTLQLLKKHLLTEQTVENYEETIAQLSRQCRALLELGHPQRWVQAPQHPSPLALKCRGLWRSPGAVSLAQRTGQQAAVAG